MRTTTGIIETSWNVKEYDLVTVSDMPSINRNIVECKVVYRRNHSQSYCSINRNIVECKGSRRIRSCLARVVLIETSWNVKYIAHISLI